MTSSRCRRASGRGKGDGGRGKRVLERSEMADCRRRQPTNLHETLFHALQQACAPASKDRQLFPDHVLVEQVHRLEMVRAVTLRLSAAISQSRHAFHGLRAEQVAPAALHLHAPHDETRHDTADESRRHQPATAARARATTNSLPAQSHIALRAASACAIDAPSAYSRSPPIGRPRAMRVTLTGVDASSRCTYTAVASPSRLGLVATITSRTLPFDARSTSATTVRSSGPTPSRGASRPPRT